MRQVLGHMGGALLFALEFLAAVGATALATGLVMSSFNILTGDVGYTDAYKALSLTGQAVVLLAFLFITAAVVCLACTFWCDLYRRARRLLDV